MRWIGIGPGHADCAESIPGPSTDYFGELAKKHELYVFLAALDGSEARKVSTIDSRVEYADGILVQWRKDGKELYFLSPDDTLMAAAVDGTGPVFRASLPQPLFKVRVPTRGILSQYQPSDDGQRFLVNTLSEETSAPQTLTLVMNWQSLVKQK